MTGGELGGWIGGIVGSLGGLVGGIAGTYFGIRNTRGPRERAFVVRCAIAWWVAIAVFLLLLFALPNPYRWLVWIPYAVLLPVGIIRGNRRQRSIRQQESPDGPAGGRR